MMNTKQAAPVLSWDTEDKLKTYAKVCFAGYPGSGKTRSAIEMAKAFTADEKIGVVNTEGASGAKVYKALYPNIKIVTISDYNPVKFIEAINFVVAAGCEAVIVDSITDEWQGTLDWKTELEKTMDTQRAWAKPTAAHDSFMKLLRTIPIHTFCTVLTKDKVVIDRKNGNKATRVNGAWIARQRTDKNFDLVLTMENGGTGTVYKTHYDPIKIGDVVDRDMATIAAKIKEFINA